MEPNDTSRIQQEGRVVTLQEEGAGREIESGKGSKGAGEETQKRKGRYNADHGRVIPEMTEKDKERFWSKVQKSDGCWNWQSNIIPKGYGTFAIHREAFFAHRIAKFLASGYFDPRMSVMHTCDNRACCRPDHLLVGTASDNMKDMVKKGRHGSVTKPNSVCKGSMQASAKLNESDIPEIRRLWQSGKRQTELSAIYQVSRVTIQRILSGRLWSHV